MKFKYWREKRTEFDARQFTPTFARAILRRL
jgi:hypothetical protein